MSIRNILVAYNGTETSERAVKLAAIIAARRDAHLTAIYAHTIPATHVQLEFYLPAASLEVMEEHEREAEERVKEKFSDLMGQQDATVRWDFLTVRGFPNDVLAEYARTYDLIVVGQPSGESGSQYYEPNPDAIALQGGRPVLVAPRGFDQMHLSPNAIVAWDGKRAAARALSDAMAILESEDKVTVLHVGKDDSAVRSPGRDVMEYLSRHGIHAELSVQAPGGVAISDIILNACMDSGAGLLVMGAYEHSRFSEMLLGGVTREVVERAHVPVLMSH